MEEQTEVFEYLDELRASGETNMLGAGSYLEVEFLFDRNEARKYLRAWMASHKERKHHSAS